MFTKLLEHIFTLQSLKEAYAKINTASSGLDEVTFEEFEGSFSNNIEELLQKILEGSYAPEPLKKIEIDKPNSDEKRPIALGALKDKIVQRVLYEELNPYFDKLFCNKSYAYRPDKSTLKAINRTTHFLNQKKLFILKTDIDNFFETINHDILLEILHKHIQDARIVRLLSLFLQTGGFKDFDYDEHLLGVHQGDILSPLLSNIYLDKMDKFLEERKVAFVRYADDFALFFEKKEEASATLEALQKFLKTLKLSLEEKKTKIVHISDGFVFLGVRFEGRSRSVENERLQKAISKLHKLAKDKTGFAKYIENLNAYLRALKNYYLKILEDNFTQKKMLQEALIASLAHKVYLAKGSKTIKTKKEFKNLLLQVEFSDIFEEERDTKDLIKHIIAIAYERYLAEKSYKDTTAKINKKKNTYAKKFAVDSTLHIAQPGLTLGVSKNKFTVKKYGKVQHTFPIDKVERIIFEGKGFALSSSVVKKCADKGIAIDFISYDATPYALLVTYNSAMPRLLSKQASLIGTPKQLELAKAFIKGKAKNQLNYLKYLNKYHKLLDTQIDSIERNIVKSKIASSVEELMGFEGSISASYWEGIKLVLDVPFEGRITQGARDIVNSSLNYAYAILYGTVQHALVQAGLALNVSYLHAMDGNKPTLTFDMIEEFRTFMVDRVVVSMLNKDEPIKLNSKGLLTKPSRQLIARNIKEKLGSYTMWKKESRKCSNIIQTQCYNLVKAIKGEEKKYKPFIGKY